MPKEITLNLHTFFKKIAANELLQKESQKYKETIIVFIGGFLVPKGRYSIQEGLPKNARVIHVYPSGVCSIHDRVMQVFYELVGGHCDYGEEHSQFHGHDRYGPTYFRGKFEHWDAENPIHIVGHSFGGITARALQCYLSESRFPGYKTNENWISSIVCINTPLNGCLRVYRFGASAVSPPVVRWGSVGCVISWIAHISEFLDIPVIKNVYDFGLRHWNLSHKKDYSLISLVNAFLGHCVHTTTDNSAYDMTLHSQQEWAKKLKTYPDTYYMTIVGTTYENSSIFNRIIYDFIDYFMFTIPTLISGIDTSKWATEVSDY